MFRCSTPSLSDSQSGIAPFDTPLPIVPGLYYAPVASVPALRQRNLHRLRRAHSVSSPFTAPIPPPPLRHSSPFRRPGSHARSVLPFHTASTIRARAGKIVISRLTVVPSGSCRAYRLACSLSGRQKERCLRIALSDFLRVERWDIRTLPAQCIMEPNHTPEANRRIYMNVNNETVQRLPKRC